MRKMKGVSLFVFGLLAMIGIETQGKPLLSSAFPAADVVEEAVYFDNLQATTSDGYTWYYEKYEIYLQGGLSGDIVTTNVVVAIGGVSPLPTGKVVVPDMLDELPVYSIRGSVFGACPDLEEVVLPSQLESVDECAFDGSPKLRRITMRLGGNENLFTRNGALYLGSPKSDCALIRVPEGYENAYFDGLVGPKVTEVYSAAFRNCTNICQIAVNKFSAEGAANADFRGCDNFTEFVWKGPKQPAGEWGYLVRNGALCAGYLWSDDSDYGDFELLKVPAGCAQYELDSCFSGISGEAIVGCRQLRIEINDSLTVSWALFDALASYDERACGQDSLTVTYLTTGSDSCAYSDAVAEYQMEHPDTHVSFDEMRLASGETWSWNVSCTRDEVCEGSVYGWLYGVDSAPSGAIRLPEFCYRATWDGYLSSEQTPIAAVTEVSDEALLGMDAVTSISFPSTIRCFSRYDGQNMLPAVEEFVFLGGVPDGFYELIEMAPNLTRIVYSANPRYESEWADAASACDYLTFVKGEEPDTPQFVFEGDRTCQVLVDIWPAKGDVTIPTVWNAGPVLGIDSAAFAHAEGLTRVSIPACVRDFPESESCLVDCPQLESIDVYTLTRAEFEKHQAYLWDSDAGTHRAFPDYDETYHFDELESRYVSIDGALYLEWKDGTFAGSGAKGIALTHYETFRDLIRCPAAKRELTLAEDLFSVSGMAFSGGDHILRFSVGSFIPNGLSDALACAYADGCSENENVCTVFYPYYPHQVECCSADDNWYDFVASFREEHPDSRVTFEWFLLPDAAEDYSWVTCPISETEAVIEAIQYGTVNNPDGEVVFPSVIDGLQIVGIEYCFASFASVESLVFPPALRSVLLSETDVASLTNVTRLTFNGCVPDGFIELISSLPNLRTVVCRNVPWLIDAWREAAIDAATYPELAIIQFVAVDPESIVWNYSLEYGYGARLIGGSGSPACWGGPDVTELDLPSEFDGYPLVEVGSEAFDGLTNLISIALPYTVKCVGFAGEGLDGVKRLEFAGGVPDGIDEFISSLPNLKTVVYSPNPRYRRDWLQTAAQYYPIEFERGEEPDEPQWYVEGDVLCGVWPNLVGDVEVPTTWAGLPIFSIASGAFSNMNEITSLKLPRVDTIAADAFYGCTSLTAFLLKELEIGQYDYSQYYVQDGVLLDLNASIGWYPAAKEGTTYELPHVGVIFDSCANLERVSIPESWFVDRLVSLSDFATCPNFRGLDIVRSPDEDYGLTYRDGMALCGDESEIYGFTERASRVTIPRTVYALSPDVFAGMSGLEELVFSGYPPNGLAEAVGQSSVERIVHSGAPWYAAEWDEVKMMFAETDELLGVRFIATEASADEAEWCASLDMGYGAYVDGFADDEIGYPCVWGGAISNRLDIPPFIEGYPVMSTGCGIFSKLSGVTSVSFPYTLQSVSASEADCSQITELIFWGRVPDGLSDLLDSMPNVTRIVYSADPRYRRDWLQAAAQYYRIEFERGEEPAEPQWYVEGDVLCGVWPNLVGDVEVPTTWAGVPIFSIASGAFSNMNAITSLKLPRVQEIAADAFCGCTSLTAFVMDEVEIGQNESSPFYVQDGVLLDLNASIGWYPAAKAETTYELPYVGVVFDSCANLERVSVRESWFVDRAVTLSDFATCPNFCGLDIVRYYDEDYGLTYQDGMALDGEGGEIYGFTERAARVTIPRSVYVLSSDVFIGMIGLEEIVCSGYPPDGLAEALNMANTWPILTVSTNPRFRTRWDAFVQTVANDYGINLTLRDLATTDLTDWCFYEVEDDYGNPAVRLCGEEDFPCVWPVSEDGVLTIPETIDGLPVIGVDDGAFAGLSNLVSVTFPPTMREMNDHFLNEECPLLAEVTMPVTMTGFCPNENLRIKLTLVRGVRSAYEDEYCLVEDLTAGVYDLMCGMSCLEELVIGEGVWFVAYEAFSNCANLKKLTLPSTLVSIGPSAFSSCEALSDVYFYGNAPALEVDAFAGSANFKVYICRDSTGWSGLEGDKVVPSTWQAGDSQHLISGFSVPVTLFVEGQNWTNLIVEAGATVGELPLPEEGGVYDFLGWYSDEQLENAVSSQALIPAAGTTFYALRKLNLAHRMNTDDLKFTTGANDQAWYGSALSGRLGGAAAEAVTQTSFEQNGRWMETVVRGPSYFAFSAYRMPQTSVSLSLLADLDDALVVTVDGECVGVRSSRSYADGWTVYYYLLDEGEHTVRWTTSWAADYSFELGLLPITVVVGDVKAEQVGSQESLAAWTDKAYNYKSYIAGDLARFAESDATKFTDDADGYAARVRHAFALLASLAESKTMADLCEAVGIRFDAFHLSFSDPPDVASDLPDVNATIDRVVADDLPALETALADIEAIPDSWTDSVVVSDSEYPVDSDVYIDAADRLYLKAVLKAAISAVRYLAGYDLTLDKSTLRTLSAGTVTFQELRDEQTEFFSKVRNQNSLDLSRNLIRSSFESALAANEKMLARTDDDLHLVECDDSNPEARRDLETISSNLVLAISSLDATLTVDAAAIPCEGTNLAYFAQKVGIDETLLPNGWVTRVYLGALFEGRLNRDYVPQTYVDDDTNTVICLDTLKDPTFAGLLPDLTMACLCDLADRYYPGPVEHSEWGVLHTLTFVSNGGTPVEPIVVPSGLAIQAPTPPTRVGYIFDGWYSDDLLTQEYVFGMMGDEDLTLYAKWSLIRYAIAYAETKGADSANPTSYTIDDAVTFVAPTNVPGWVFRSWNPPAIERGTVGDLTVTASWDRVRCNVAVAGTSQIYEYGETVTLSTVASLTNGWTNIVCVGWSGTGDVPASGSGSEVSFTVTQSSSIVWNYATNFYVSVTTVGNGSVVLQDSLGRSYSAEGCWVANGMPLMATATPDRGWSFVRWVNVETGVPLDSPLTKGLTFVADRPQFVSAEFVREFFDVVFDANGGVASETSRTVSVGGVLGKLPTVDSRKGWKFEGWFTAVDGGEQVTAKTSVASDATYYAHWQEVHAEELYGIVGVSFSYDLYDFLSELDLAQGKCTLKKQPSGIKVDTSNGQLKGVPTKAGVYTVTVVDALKQERVITFTVDTIPDWAVGNFVGFIRESDQDDRGTATLTVSKNGKASGKFIAAGQTWSFTASSFDADSTVNCMVLVGTAKSGKVTREVSFELTGSDETSTLMNGVVSGTTSDQAELTLWRNVWKDKNAASTVASLAGLYTAQLMSLESGDGYLSLKVDAKGGVKVTGKLPDGTSASSSPLLVSGDGSGGDLFAVWTMSPSSYKGGAVTGLLHFNESDTYTIYGEDCLWSSLAPTATVDYGDGFVRKMSVTGAYYDKGRELHAYYDSLAVSVGTDSFQVKVKYTDYEDGKKTSWTELEDVESAVSPDRMELTVGYDGKITAPTSTKPTKITGSNEWEYNGATDAAFKMSFTKATGIFKGSFVAWYDYASSIDYTKESEKWTHTSKKISFEGIWVQGGSLSGFYLLDRQGEYEDEKTSKVKTFKYKDSRLILLNDCDSCSPQD